MKKKFLVSIILIIVLLFLSSNRTYAYTCTLTNKIEGEYNDRNQEIQYVILASKYGTITISGVEYEVEDIVVCNCKQYFLGNDYFRVHDAATNYEHSTTTTTNKFYVFTLKNNEKATIEVSSDRTITIYRMCNSGDNQTVTYSTDNGTTKVSMPKNDMDSSTGMSSGTGIKLSSASSMIVYNTYTLAVPGGVNTSALVIGFLTLFFIILFAITKLIKRAKVTTA
jgi:hypothetical protein